MIHPFHASMLMHYMKFEEGILFLGVTSTVTRVYITIELGLRSSAIYGVVMRNEQKTTENSSERSRSGVIFCPLGVRLIMGCVVSVCVSN